MHNDAGAVKTAAVLELVSSPTQGSPEQKLPERPTDSTTAQTGHTALLQQAEWYDQQQRQQQRDEPPGGPSTSQQTMLKQRQREHGRVKFAASEAPDEVAASSASSSGAGAAEPAAANAAVMHGEQHHHPQQQQAADDDPAGSSTPRGGREAAPSADGPTGHASFFSRMKKSLGDSMRSRGGHPGANDGTTRLHHSTSGVSQTSQAESQADTADPSSPRHGQKTGGSEPSHAGPTTFSASIKGLLGAASSRLLGSWAGRASTNAGSEGGAEEEEELWFTSLDDFKPICHMLHRGRYMTAYFACANKTGQHFLLKKYDKHKMVPAEERGVRRAIAFSELLHHANLVRCMGQWEEADTIYVVEEYAGKGDIFNDCISHPEKYTERHVAVVLVKPLLKALAYLHANNIIHRCVLPENLYMGIDDVLRLGHLTLSVDQLSDRPKSRTALLDYMAPEMLSVKPHNDYELALGLLDDTSSEDGEDSDGGAAAVAADAANKQQQLGRSTSGVAGAGVAAQGQAAGGSSSGASGKQQQQQGVPLAKQGSRSLSALLDDGVAVAVVREASRTSSRHQRSGVSFSLGSAAANGRAEWEYRDYYDEKVDIWQVGCMVHELLCGSMPFEVESKLESAGLALWADIEQPPGSLPPDCVSFLQQALTKDPRQRPAAEQLLSHAWLARCEAGEPWRDPAELEAARKAAELTTVWGWLRHNSRAAAAALSGWTHQVVHGGRVAPLTSSWEQQFGADGLISGPASPSKLAAPSAVSLAGVGTGPHPSFTAAGATRTSSQFSPGKQPLPPPQQQQQIAVGSATAGVSVSSSRPAVVPPLKLTEELVGKLNAVWAPAHAEGSEDGSAAACVVSTSVATYSNPFAAKQQEQQEQQQLVI